MKNSIFSIVQRYQSSCFRVYKIAGQMKENTHLQAFVHSCQQRGLTTRREAFEVPLLVLERGYLADLSCQLEIAVSQSQFLVTGCVKAHFIKLSFSQLPFKAFSGLFSLWSHCGCKWDGLFLLGCYRRATPYSELLLHSQTLLALLIKTKLCLSKGRLPFPGLPCAVCFLIGFSGHSSELRRL